VQQELQSGDKEGDNPGLIFYREKAFIASKYFHMSEQGADCSDICFALSDKTRLQILFLLEDGELDVGHIVKRMGKPQSLISHHLKILRDANLVENHYLGKSIMYGLADPSVKDFLESLKRLADYLAKLGLCFERGRKGVIVLDRRVSGPGPCAESQPAGKA